MSSATEPDALPSTTTPPVQRLAYRLDELAQALGVSRRLLERERSAGRLPKPNLRMGRISLWGIDSVRDWIAGGGK